VAELRGEEPPTERFDPRAKGLRETGDFHQPERKKPS